MQQLNGYALDFHVHFHTPTFGGFFQISHLFKVGGVGENRCVMAMEVSTEMGVSRCAMVV